MDDLDAIRLLGEGGVAEETLAIAIYCSLKYSTDFNKAIVAVVNHSGDSDSTGAVTGNILGAYLGLKGIPQKYLDNLELKEIILEMAEDLYNGCQITEYGDYHDEIWEQKYIYKTYKMTDSEMKTRWLQTDWPLIKNKMCRKLGLKKDEYCQEVNLLSIIGIDENDILTIWYEGDKSLIENLNLISDKALSY